MEKEDLQQLLTLLTGLIIPFIVNRYASLKWSSQAKFALIVVLSLAGGFLNFATTEGGIQGKSWVQIVVNSAFAAIAFYQIAFRALGLESIVSPKNALVNKAKKKIQDKVSGLSKNTVKDILTPGVDTTLEVTAKVVE